MSATMLRFALGCLLLLVLLALAMRSVQAESQEQIFAQLERGAELYAWSCAVCHGEGGRGFGEARRAFPDDHQGCEWCHKPSNPRQMTLEQMTPHNAFSLGEAPALVGAESLTAFPNALSLYSYIQATMPRYEPARHSSEEYLDITAYVLKLRGILPDDLLTPDTATTLRLR